MVIIQEYIRFALYKIVTSISHHKGQCMHFISRDADVQYAHVFKLIKYHKNLFFTEIEGRKLNVFLSNDGKRLLKAYNIMYDLVANPEVQ